MKKSYYRKLLSMYSIVFFVLTVVFSGIYFINANRMEAKRTDEQNRVLFMDYVKAEEDKLAGLIRSSNKIAALNSTMSFAISTGTDYYRKMAELRDDLSMLGDGGAKTLCFVQKKNDRSCITNYQSTLMAVQLAEFGLGEVEYNRITSSFGKNDLHNYQFAYTDDGILYLTTKTINNSRVHIGVFTRYNTLKKYDDNTYASFYIAEEHISDTQLSAGEIAPDNGARSGLEVYKEADDEKIRMLAGDRQQIREMREGKNRYYYIDSKYNNNRYYLRTKAASFSVLDSIRDYLPFVLITTILGFSVILYISKRLYAPIEELVTILLNMEGHEAEQKSVGNDIEYLARQVSQLRSENQDLARTLKESQS